MNNVWKDVTMDSKYLTCFRSCLDQPEHLEWIDPIWDLLDKTANEVLRGIYN
jgi:tyrosine decarboxylase / aspartate 1-decarboxylase